MSIWPDAASGEYVLDELTNRFLKRYPIHCELREGELRNRTLHLHDGYEIYLCLEGHGSYIVEDSLYPLHPGTLTVIGPHVAHHPFARSDRRFKRYVLSVSEPYFERIDRLCPALDGGIGRSLTEGAAGSHYFLSAPQLERARTTAEAITGLLGMDGPLRELELLHRITELVLFVGELQQDPETRQSAGGSNELLVQEVLTYLTAAYRERITIDDLLERFPVSRSQLLHLFKATTGYTIVQFVTEYRLHKAKSLLVDTELPMTEVAALAGFGDLSHFYHLFRRASGMTPLQYRRRALNRR